MGVGHAKRYPRQCRYRYRILSMARSAKQLAIPAAALFSFLKETRGITNWATRDLSKAFKLSRGDATDALAVLEMQGYIKSAGAKGHWLTTEAGEVVSGSKFPRYSRESVEQSLGAFADHIKRVNEDQSAEYKVADAVAFGDFLSGRARVQAADVGIRLAPRNPAAQDAASAGEREKQETFLKQLKGKSPLLNMQPYAEWMSARTHRRLV